MDNMLFLNVHNEKVVRNIKVVFDGPNIDLMALTKKLNIAIGKKYNATKIDRNISKILYYLRDHGLGKNKISIIKKVEGLNVDIIYTVESSAEYILSKVIFAYKNDEVNNSYLSRKFNRLLNKKWNRLNFKTKLDEVYKDLLSVGHYHSIIESSPPEFNDKSYNVVVTVNIDKGKRFSFEFFGNDSIPTVSLKTAVIEKIKNTNQENIDELISDVVTSYYEQKGFFNIKTHIRKVESHDRYNNLFKNYHIQIKENLKNKVVGISFSGNSLFSDLKIKKYIWMNLQLLHGGVF